ncbi:MAG: O-methyltransferase [Pyrinomonadaceae bacterium]
MPEFLRRILNTRREARELKSVARFGCKVEHLRSASEVNLAEVFGSGELEREWRTIAPRLRPFDIPDGTGGVNPGDRRAIFYLTRYFKPRSVLEVGTHIGASTLHIAAALHDVQSLENQERPNFVSVDVCDVNDPLAQPWLRHGTRSSPVTMIDELGCGHFVRFVTDDSLDYLVGRQQKYDLIFLDGDHAAKTVYQEIPLALDLLERDGLILLHDYFPRLHPLWSDGAVIPGPCLAANRLRAEGAEFDVLPLGRLPWPTKLKSNITSLALLVRTSN